MYSQNGEEIHIARIVGDQPGRFLDIGAYNPKLFSNTRALYERGWSGVMVEASPGPFLDLLAEYGKDERIKLVCAAVTTRWRATKGRLLEFRHSEAGVGTSNEAHYQKWRDKVTWEGSFFAPVITVSDILQSLVSMEDQKFSFINIDVEGESADLFLDALELFSPKCWCVEHDGQQEKLTQAAILRGYSQYHINGENVIYSRIQS